MPTLKKAFLLEQALQSTIIASLQHASVYKDGVFEQNKNDLRQALRESLSEFAKQYTVSISDDMHVQNIDELADTISAKCSASLVDNHLRIGIAQKALNLYLKYLWCLDEIQTPPHCPFDSVVIAHLPQKVRVPWTKLDDISIYRKLVAAAKQVAAGSSLADWELAIYQSR